MRYTARGLPQTGQPGSEVLAALRALAVVPATTPPSDVTEPAAVRLAQQQLQAKGYTPGVADGVIGPATRAAINRFQADADLLVTGRLNAQTLERLRTPTDSAPMVVDAALLRRVQLALSGQGHDAGPADGAMGPRTRTAIASARRQAGLPEGDGIDAALLQVLGISP